ncbi:oxygen-dependent coproporphyrinogen oxidase [Paraflavisolibacter sp. H34]|uniref:oxygen-dependent coproporphyrinogen oxidase n=1 Tax=Huijunlia imazamoxiresistens TaxID=3127457 RepID=UPI00301AB6A0
MNATKTTGTPTAFKDRFHHYILDLQNKITGALERIDGVAVFEEDPWVREEGGGGISRIITNGAVFEKGGVNTSAVFGKLPLAMQQAFKVPESNFFACGLSLVLHPQNPYVPTVHANWRYFELYDTSDKKIDSWFGGGSDLTPYYLFEEDARHFHSTFKNAIDPFGAELFPKYKKQCDEYFVNRHRNNEARGIGGVFYDYLRPEGEADVERLFQFQQANGNAFLDAYLPIVEKRKDTPFSEREIEWQEIRRGRYVEFNLIHDRGTLFGLKTNGRTESILMSLPMRARWYYNYQPQPGSAEEQLQQACLHPRDWA